MTFPTDTSPPNPLFHCLDGLQSPHPRNSSTTPALPREERGLSEITAPIPVHQETSQTFPPSLSNHESTSSQVPTETLPPYQLPTPSSASPHVIEAPPDEKLPPPSLIVTLIYLSLFSIVGTATRLGLILLTTYPTPPASPLIWAQFTGCFIMGLCQSMLPIFTAKDAPVFIGLTTGYAGSITSFSSFMYDAFAETSYSTLVASGGKRKGGGQGVLAVLGYIIITLCVSFGALRLGRNVGRWLHLQIGIEKMSRVVLKGLDYAATACCMAVFPLALFLGIFATETNRRFLWGLVFSPPGAILRYALSRTLNPKVREFPLGTFTVNIFGTAVLAGGVAGRIVLDRRGGVGAERGEMWILAVVDGFCGCATTVSTFVVEAEGLRMRKCLLYVGTSIVLGLGIMVGILGGYVWSLE